MNVRLSWSLGKTKIYIVEKGGFFEDMGTSKELSERLGLSQRSINEIASKTRRGLMPKVPTKNGRRIYVFEEEEEN